jgi:hypothetical protein
MKNSNIPWNTIEKVLSKSSPKEMLRLVQQLYKLNQENRTYIQTKYGLVDPIKTYKDILRECFHSDNLFDDLGLSSVKKAIRQYKQVVGDTKGILELTIFSIERGTQATLEYGDMNGSFYDSLETLFFQAVNILKQSDPSVIDHYLPRLRSVVKKADGIGWGYYDTIADVLREEYPGIHNF